MKNINKTNVLPKNYFQVIQSIFDLDNSKSLVVKKALNQYVSLMVSRISSRGPKETVTFLKEVNTLSVKLTLGIPFSNIP